MSDSSPEPPRFRKPPVVETILGVYFRPNERLSLVKRVQLWSDRFAADFPVVEERAPLEEVREEFSDGVFPSGPQVQVRWQVTPPSARIWAKSEDNKHTIQIQHDAFFANWERDLDAAEPYMHYAIRKHDFKERLLQVDQYLRTEEIGCVEPTSCFVTYINHIELAEDVGFSELLQRLLTVWRNETSDDWLPPVETVQQNFSFPMPNKMGRLHVAISRAVRNQDSQQIVRFDLTARGAPNDATIPAALEWLDLGHDWVVRGFASLTRPEMHDKWERYQ